MKKATLIGALILVFISCKHTQIDGIPDGNNFFFENPQPINDSELNSIPNKFQGVFVNSDSVYLNIKKNIIFTESETKFRFHKNQMDSLMHYFDVVNDEYILKENKEVFKSKFIGDSIEFTSKNRDTIFAFSDFQKAKRINGNLILNQKDSIYWKVKLVSLYKNSLTIKEIYSDDDLKRMDSITKIHSKRMDSVTYIISPSRNEFKRFSEIKDFGYDSKFIKVKK